jgi:hypothetical protein
LIQVLLVGFDRAFGRLQAAIDDIAVFADRPIAPFLMSWVCEAYTGVGQEPV